MARTEQAFTAWPARMTVQAPQLPPIARSLGAGDFEMVVQRIKQGDTRLDIQLVHFTIDAKRNGNWAGTDYAGRRGRGERVLSEYAAADGAAAQPDVAEKSAA